MSAFLNRLFGPARWSYCWLKNGEAVDFFEVCRDYERSYDALFDSQPGLLDQITQYGEVYDTDIGNVQAGLDYSHKDEQSAVHIQDIAVRNIVARSGRSFTPGAPLLQIRTTSESELGRYLSPFYVPFHTPELILLPDDTERRWLPDSVEAFYQSNRRLAIAADVHNAGSVAALHALINAALSGEAGE